MSDLTQGNTGLLFFSMIIQFIVEQLKNILPLEKIPTTIVKPQLWSLIVSLAVAFAFKVDMFDTLGFSVSGPTWISYILTAILISGGSGVFNEIIKSLTAIKQGKIAAVDPTVQTSGTGIQVNPVQELTPIQNTGEVSAPVSNPEASLAETESAI